MAGAVQATPKNSRLSLTQRPFRPIKSTNHRHKGPKFAICDFLSFVVMAPSNQNNQ